MFVSYHVERQSSDVEWTCERASACVAPEGKRVESALPETDTGRGRTGAVTLVSPPHARSTASTNVRRLPQIRWPPSDFQGAAPVSRSAPWRRARYRSYNPLHRARPRAPLLFYPYLHTRPSTHDQQCSNASSCSSCCSATYQMSLRHRRRFPCRLRSFVRRLFSLGECDRLIARPRGRYRREAEATGQVPAYHRHAPRPVLQGGRVGEVCVPQAETEEGEATLRVLWDAV